MEGKVQLAGGELTRPEDGGFPRKLSISNFFGVLSVFRGFRPVTGGGWYGCVHLDVGYPPVVGVWPKVV